MTITAGQWIEFTTLYFHPEKRPLEFAGESYGRAFCQYFKIDDRELSNPATQMSRAIDIIKEKHCEQPPKD